MVAFAIVLLKVSDTSNTVLEIISDTVLTSWSAPLADVITNGCPITTSEFQPPEFEKDFPFAKT